MHLHRHDVCYVQDNTTSQRTQLIYSCWNVNKIPPKCEPIFERAEELGLTPMAVSFWLKVEQFENNIILLFIFSLQLSFTYTTSVDPFLPSGHYYNSLYKAVSLHPPFTLPSLPQVNQVPLRCTNRTQVVACLMHKSVRPTTRPVVEIRSGHLSQGDPEDTSPPDRNDYHVGWSQWCSWTSSFDCKDVTWMQ